MGNISIITISRIHLTLMALRQLVRIPVRWKSAISSPCCTRGLSSSTSSEPKIHHTQLGPNAQKYQLHPTVAHRAIHQTSALATDADDDNPEEAGQTKKNLHPKNFASAIS